MPEGELVKMACREFIDPETEADACLVLAGIQDIHSVNTAISRIETALKLDTTAFIKAIGDCYDTYDTFCDEDLDTAIAEIGETLRQGLDEDEPAKPQPPSLKDKDSPSVSAYKNDQAVALRDRMARFLVWLQTSQ